MDILKKFKKSAILVHILYHAEKEPFYGTWLMEELKRHSHNISPGTLYPWLNELHEQNILYRSEENHKGKIRKYYKITPNGLKEFDK
ncbi:MAG: helix-turn-helix transcriptional regulator, partial [archaeon]|nr:helix-turn-helix transcriptional regulator [archaeon]